MFERSVHSGDVLKASGDHVVISRQFSPRDRDSGLDAQLVFEIVPQPGLGKGPLLANTIDGEAQRFGDNFVAQTAKMVHFHNLRRLAILRRKPSERLVQGKNLIVTDIVLCDVAVGHPLPLAAMFEPLFAAGVFDQDAAHGLGRSRKEMPASIPLPGLGDLHESQIGFMNQGRRVERLPGPLLSHAQRRQLAQFAVNRRQQLCGSDAITPLDRRQNRRDVAHSNEYSRVDPTVLLLSRFREGIVETWPTGIRSTRFDRAGHFKRSGMSDQPPNSSAKSGTSRPRWLMLVLPLINLAAVVVLLLAIKWDRDDRTKQLEHLKRESEHLQSQLNELQRAVDERQKQGGEKQPPEAKPGAGGQKSGAK
jgi:hypothetical protein